MALPLDAQGAQLGNELRRTGGRRLDVTARAKHGQMLALELSLLGAQQQGQVARARGRLQRLGRSGMHLIGQRQSLGVVRRQRRHSQSQGIGKGTRRAPVQVLVHGNGRGRGLGRQLRSARLTFRRAEYVIGRWLTSFIQVLGAVPR